MVRIAGDEIARVISETGLHFVERNPIVVYAEEGQAARLQTDISAGLEVKTRMLVGQTLEALRTQGTGNAFVVEALLRQFLVEVRGGRGLLQCAVSR